MELFLQILGLILFYIFIFPKIYRKAWHHPKTFKGTNQQGTWEGGYFIFSDERGVNQPDTDPFLNSDYDNGGPDW